MSELIIDVKKIRSNVDKIRNAIRVDKFYYSLKANSEFAVLQELQKTGCLFEIASMNEFRKVLQVGAQSENVICGLPVKPVELVKQLGQKELKYFVFEDMHEYEKLNMYASSNKKVMRLYISDIDKESAPWGIKIDDLEDIVLCNKDFFHKIDGLCFHIARNYQVRKMERVFERMEQVLPRFEGRDVIVNLGGGMRGELPPHLALKYKLEQYYEKVNEQIFELKYRYHVDFYCEPGRGVVQSACHIVTEIELATQRDGIDAVFIDLNIGIPVGAHPYKITVICEDEEEEVYNIMQQMSQDRKNLIQTTFFDTICEYESFFTLPLKRKLHIGEKIKMYGMGAYTNVRSSVFHARDLLPVKVE